MGNQTQQAVFVDQSVTPPGTLLSAINLNTAATAGNCLISPNPLGATASGLVITLPAIVVIVNPAATGGGSVPQQLSVSGTTVTVGSTGNTTYYVYLSSAGTYSYGTAATSTGLATICHATTNSGGTALGTVTQDSTPYALTADETAAATGASISGFTYSALSTIGDQIRAIGTAIGSLVDSAARTAINTLTGTSFGANTKAAILSDGTNSGATVTLPSLLIATSVQAGSVQSSNLSSTAFANVGGQLQFSGTGSVIATVGTAAGSGGTATISRGASNAGLVHVQTGTGTSAGTIVTVSSAAITGNSLVFLVPATGAAASTDVYVSTISSGIVAIGVFVPPAASTGIDFFYLVLN